MNDGDDVSREPRIEGILSAVEELEQELRTLRAALLSNRRIGVAMGIVMTQLGVSEAEAFEAIRRASMDGNRKLREVAEDVVLTGALPGTGSDAQPGS